MRAAAAAALAAASLLAGCQAAPRLLAVASGAVAGGATANPAIGFAVGVATDAAATAGLQYAGRTRHRAEQDEIAAVAGALEVGARAPWRVGHAIPVGDEQGLVEVVRLIENPLAPCREIVFSVAAGGDPAAAPARWYEADVCRQDRGWKWASAEPVVGRWGYLQ